MAASLLSNLLFFIFFALLYHLFMDEGGVFYGDRRYCWLSFGLFVCAS